MRATYSERYLVNFGLHHPFPIRKYPLLYQQLVAEGTLDPDRIIEPTPAALGDIRLVHTADYVRRLFSGELTAAELRRIGLPWSEALVLRARVSVQGTITASRIAIHAGLAANLAGGTHHAFPDHGEGYCLLNDIAIAIRVLQRDRWMQHVAIIDCDVHQGNANAAIFGDDPDVFTFSIHGANNYPLHKVTGDLDVALPDGTGDEGYLAALREHLPQVLAEFRPGLVFYLAGVDPLAGDRLGRLRVSLEGLRQRDDYVLRTCRGANIPTVITLGGGYAEKVEDTVEAHCNTIRIVRALFGLDRSRAGPGGEPTKASEPTHPGLDAP